MNNSTTEPLFYILPNLTPGATYKIRLHWATFSDGGAGRRFINVLVNGQPVISHLDVYATAGGDLKAIVREVSGIADGAGNLVVALTSDTGFMYVSAFLNALEVLQGSGVVTNTFDPNGNLQTATDWTGTATFTWDSENRLLSVANGLNGTETYTYASDGMRRKKVTSAQTTNFVWDGQNVLQERSVSNVRLAQYTDYPGEWGGLTSQRQGSTSSYYGFDGQNSTRILVSIAGVITDNYAYKVFGEELAQGQGPNAQYTNNPYRYVGQVGYYRDCVSRLYVRERNLNLTLGRWASNDPVGFNSYEWNPYMYVQNRPLFWSDPSGLRPYKRALPKPTSGLPPRRPIIQPECKEFGLVNQGLNLACAAIISLRGQSCINRLSPESRDCMNDFCMSFTRPPVSIRCGSPKCACEPSFGYSNLGIGSITVCTSNWMNQPSWWDSGVNNAQEEMANTLLHEAAHTCGLADRDRGFFPLPSNPPEDLSRCIFGLPNQKYLPSYGPWIPF